MSQPITATARGRRYRHIRAVLIVVLVADLATAGARIGYGYLTGSLAMIADGVHAALHALGGVIAIVGVRLAMRSPDADHPYGYERYEPLAAMGIAGFMLVAGWNLVAGAWRRLHTAQVPDVDAGSFAIMGVSMAVAILLARWERARGERLQSSLLCADAARVRADVLISAAVVAGLIAARLGVAYVDEVLSVVIAIAVAISAWRIVRGASRVLTDAAVGDVRQIVAVAHAVPGVIDCHQVRARGVGGMVRVDLHVTVDPRLTVPAGHQIAEAVEHRVREQVPGIAEVLVHVGSARGGHAAAAQPLL